MQGKYKYITFLFAFLKWLVFWLDFMELKPSLFCMCYWRLTYKYDVPTRKQTIRLVGD